MNILLTGSTGFIGKHILASLSHTYSFYTPTHSQLDLLDEEKVQHYMQTHPVDIVIHCAVIGGNRKDQYVEHMFYDNLRIFFNIIRCKKYYNRMLNIGSGAEYDKRFPIKNVKESDFGKHIPDEDYGLYKYICSEYISHLNNCTDLRIFGIFGEGEDYRRRFISNALCRCIMGLPITMNHNVLFDYLDIVDLVKIIDFFIRHKPKYSAYNIGTGKSIDLYTIAKEIVAIHARPCQIKRKSTTWAHEYTCNNKRLIREIPSLTFTPLRQSLMRLYAWYEKNKQAIKKEDL